MTSKPGNPTPTGQPSQRFVSPATPVDERIDEIATYHPDKQHQTEWLKRTLKENWNGDLPQPFVAFDGEENAFVLVWQSDTECNTLHIDAETRNGTYCPWPDNAPEEPLEELDLTTTNAWRFLQKALTGTTNRPSSDPLLARARQDNNTQIN